MDSATLRSVSGSSRSITRRRRRRQCQDLVGNPQWGEESSPGRSLGQRSRRIVGLWPPSGPHGRAGSCFSLRRFRQCKESTGTLAKTFPRTVSRFAYGLRSIECRELIRRSEEQVPDAPGGRSGCTRLVPSNQSLAPRRSTLDKRLDRKSTRLNSSHVALSRMPSSA